MRSFSKHTVFLFFVLFVEPLFVFSPLSLAWLYKEANYCPATQQWFCHRGAGDSSLKCVWKVALSKAALGSLQASFKSVLLFD